MKLAVPDLVSPSYFPAIAAVDLGLLGGRGLAAELELRYPVTDAVDALRAGEIDVLAGSAHALFHRAADGGGIRLLAALSQGTYWFLVVRSDLGFGPCTPLGALRGLRIGAAPGPIDALAQMLADAGVEPGAVDVGPVPGTGGAGVSFGVTAAEALADGRIDGFWANGMGAEVAVRRGIGTVVVDARRHAPVGADRYTFPALMATLETCSVRREELEAAVAGVVEAQRRLRARPELATTVAAPRFPPLETELIETLIARDARFYDPAITDGTLADLVAFAQRRGMTSKDLGAGDLVAPGASAWWSPTAAARVETVEP
jgi:NitT/TauT family transport system substrate-binding protein